MGIREQFGRWLFVMETRLKVARQNHSAERAFLRPGAQPSPFPAVTPQFAGGIMLLVFLAAGAAIFIGRPSPEAALQGVSMPVISNANFAEPSREAALAPNLPAPEEYAIAVDKANKTLLVLKDEGEYYAVVRSYEISLGKMVGPKERSGDMRTPVGFYHITEIKDGKLLPKIYGPRVFVTDYPNSFDVAMGRTGGGIWLHGSGLGKKTPDTKGCVEMDDENVKALEKWVRVNTPVATYPDTFRLPVQNGRIEKKYFSMEFFYGDTAPLGNAG